MRRSFLQSLCLLIAVNATGVIIAIPALAAPSSSPSATAADSSLGGNVSVLPAVSVENVVLNPTSAEGAITGNFTLRNENDIPMSDLGYELMLIDAAPSLPENVVLPESYNLYDRVVRLEKISLTSQQAKTLSFSYQPPLLPKGDYRLRIRVVNSHELELGWNDTPIAIGGDTGFIAVYPRQVITVNEPEGQPALYGVTSDPGRNIKLTYQLTNFGTKDVSGTPIVSVKDWGFTGTEVSHVTGSKIQLSSNRSTQGSITFTAPTKPTAYYLAFTVVDDAGKTVSSVGEFRVVVAGASGRIVSSTFDGNGNVYVDVAGPADQTNSIKAITTVSLLSGSTVVTEKNSDVLELGPEGARSAVVNFSDQLPLPNSNVRVELKTTDGTVLDSYEYAIDASNISLKAAQLSWIKIGIIAAAIIIAALIILAIRIRHKRRAITIGGSALIVLLAIGTLFVYHHPLAAQAQSAGQGKVYFYQEFHYIYAYINTPKHDQPIGTYDPARVPISFEIKWQMCNNRPTWGAFAVDYLTAGGKIVPTTNNWIPTHDTVMGSKNNSYWKQPGESVPTGIAAYNGSLADKNNWTVRVQPQEFYASSTSYAHASYSGSISIDPSLKDTTLRITGHKRQCIGGTCHLAPATNWFGIYEWLNLKTSPTPTPTPSKQCSDEKDNDNDGKMGCDDPGCYPNDDMCNNCCDPNDNDENQTPVAVISPGKQVCVGETTTISGIESYDSDGSLTKYDWQVALNSTIITNAPTADGKNTSFTPDRAGLYTTSLKVTDNLNEISVPAISQFTVVDCSAPPENKIPVAVISPVGEACISKPGAVNTITLDASGSYDRDGFVSGYQWDLTPETTLNLKDNGNQASFTAPTEPTHYTVNLTATDNEGATSAKATAEIVVKNCGDNTENQPPLAKISSVPSVCIDQSLESYVNAVSNGSYDSDGTIAEYIWKVYKNNDEDNVVPHVSTSTGGGSIRFQATKDEISTYTIALKVKDNKGAESSVAKWTLDSKYCCDVCAFKNPVAVISVPGSACSGDVIMIDSSGSYDEDGSIVGYIWKVDGVEVGNSSNKSAIQLPSLTTGKTYTISLQVKDNDEELSNIAEGSIKITDCSLENINFNLSAAPQCPTEIITATDASLNNNGTITRQWAIAPQPSSSSGLPDQATISFVPGKFGEYLVTLKAKNQYMTEWGTAQKSVSITNKAPTVSVSGPTTATVMKNVTVNANANDICAGKGDNVTEYLWTITEPDGSILRQDQTYSSASTITFVPSNIGQYGIQVKVKDQAGAVATSDTKTIVVSAPPVTPPDITEPE